MMEQTNRTRVKAPALSFPDVKACPPAGRKNDVVPPNLPGRGITDGNNCWKNIFNFKQYSLIGTLNVRTLRKDGHISELVDNFVKSNLTVLGLADHKIVHDDDILIQHLNGHLLVTTSAWRTENNASIGGVGFLITGAYEHSLADIRPINERILIVEFSGNPKTTIIINYSPTEGSEGSQAHYEALENTINAIPKHNLILVLGDFNAHLGTEHVPFSYHEKTNQNGNFLNDLCTGTGLLPTNTLFCKRPSKLWTYISDMTGRKTQIDFILVNKKWRNSIHNCEAYSCFSSLGSDHRLVTAKVKISLRMCKTPKRQVRYDWTTLYCPDLQEAYTVEVKNRFSILSAEGNGEIETDISEQYDRFIFANEEAKKLLIPEKKKREKGKH